MWHKADYHRATAERSDTGTYTSAKITAFKQWQRELDALLVHYRTICWMSTPYTDPTIDQYLRDRLMPVEGAIPHLPGIEMYGNSIPAGAVGGDLFEYINFQQRYDIDARIERAQRLAKEFLEPLPSGVPMRNAVDDHVQWLRRTAGFTPEMETEYRFARSSEQVRVAEDLRDLYLTAGFLVVDAQGHGIISAKIASTVHDTFHALMLTELDRYEKNHTRAIRKYQPATCTIGHGSQCAGHQ